MSENLDERFDRQVREWRDPAQVVAQWSEAGEMDDRTLELEATGAWWPVLEATGATLIVSREYEHLLLAITAVTRPRVSYLRVPHPSGIAFDRAGGKLYVASTRNPNQLFEFAPVVGTMPRGDATAKVLRPALPLVPTRTWYLPGCSYIHEIGRAHV